MLEIGELLCEGKSKRLYATNDPDVALLYFKDEARAFQGLKRGRILGKGEVNNVVCRRLYEQLAALGIETHYISQVDPRQSLVRVVEMIPIKVKVRNIVAGSLVDRMEMPEGTRLPRPVIEYRLKDQSDSELVNATHIEAKGLATYEEMNFISATALKINEFLCSRMKEINIEVIDFQMEFGRWRGKILLADEITPDVARFWDARTGEPMDIDRFRRDLGDVAQGYQEVLRRLMGMEE